MPKALAWPLPSKMLVLFTISLKLSIGLWSIFLALPPYVIFPVFLSKNLFSKIHGLLNISAILIATTPVKPLSRISEVSIITTLSSFEMFCTISAICDTHFSFCLSCLLFAFLQSLAALSYILSCIVSAGLSLVARFLYSKNSSCSINALNSNSFSSGEPILIIPFKIGVIYHCTLCTLILPLIL